MGRILFVCLALLLGFANAALSQDEAAIRIEQDKGEMIRLPQPAASVFIANPDVGDIQVMSPTTVYLFGRRAGETSLIAVDANENVLMSRRVIVTANLSGLERALRRELPDRRIAVEAMEDGVVISGSVNTPAEAENARRIAERFVAADGGRVLNRLAVRGSTQVMLRVRVSEVAREIREDLGINWENVFNIGNGFQVLLGTGVTDIRFDGGGVIRTPNQMNVFLGYENSRVDVNGLIDALARDGLITVLAEPNLVAANGETASFLAGGEYPIPAPNDDGGIGIQYKQFGVSLSFTPTVTGEDRISMRVRPEVSQLTDVGGLTLPVGSNIAFQIPAIATRRTETTVELASGQSFAIAGLLQNNMDQAITKFPFLGDVPVLGALFRSTQFRRNETELVIVVTPYIVQPVSGPALALPTDTIVPASFLDRVLLGRLSAPADGSRPRARLGLNGPVGFAVE